MRAKIPKPVPADVIDFFDYAPSPELRDGKAVRRAVRNSTNSRCADIFDDWPSCVPISENELDLFEVHFEIFLDGLLGAKD